MPTTSSIVTHVTYITVYLLCTVPLLCHGANSLKHDLVEFYTPDDTHNDHAVDDWHYASGIQFHPKKTPKACRLAIAWQLVGDSNVDVKRAESYIKEKLTKNSGRIALKKKIASLPESLYIAVVYYYKNEKQPHALFRRARCPVTEHTIPVNNTEPLYRVQLPGPDEHLGHMRIHHTAIQSIVSGKKS